MVFLVRREKSENVTDKINFANDSTLSMCVFLALLSNLIESNATEIIINVHFVVNYFVYGAVKSSKLCSILWPVRLKHLASDTCQCDDEIVERSIKRALGSDRTDTRTRKLNRWLLRCSVATLAGRFFSSVRVIRSRSSFEHPRKLFGDWMHTGRQWIFASSGIRCI